MRPTSMLIGVLAGVMWSVSVRAQMVTLPFVLRDDMGSTWDVQHDGSIGDGGGDLYDGGGHLFVNHNMQYYSNGQTAVFNPGANEVLLPRTQLGNVMVARRITVIKPFNCARFVEIFENPTDQSQRLLIRCHFNLGGSVRSATPLQDPKRDRQPIGYAIQDHNRALAMIGAARGSKVAPQFQYQVNNDNVHLHYTVDLPPRQSLAIAHFQLRGLSADQVSRAWEQIRERDLLKDLPKDLRRKIVNWPTGEFLPGNLELLRGGAQDVVELRGTDYYRGTLKMDTIRLQTLYGVLEIPASRVLGIFNQGTYRPTQLVVTTDGDVFGGRMDERTLELHMGWGQVTRIPMTQITRVRFRHRPGEPEELTLENKAVAFLRDGQRFRVAVPAASMRFATSVGVLTVAPSVVASIVYQAEDSTVPDLRLVDGSRISALSTGSFLDVHAPGAGRSLRLPTNCMMRVTLRPEQEPERLAPGMTLANGDHLVATITGTLSLQTPFDTLHIDGPQVKKMVRAAANKGGDQDVHITLWDDSIVSGRLNEAAVNCLLRCGLNVRVPIGLVGQYLQPLPQPSDRVVVEIRRFAQELDSDSFARREDAQRRILSIGPPAMRVLREVRTNASVEATGRVDLMLLKLELQLEGKPAVPAMIDTDGDGIPDAPLNINWNGNVQFRGCFQMR